MPAGLQVFNQTGTLLFDSSIHKVLTFKLQITFYRNDCVRDGDYMVYKDSRIKLGMICLPIGYGAATGTISGVVQNGGIAISIHDYNQRMGNSLYTANFLGVGA